MNNQILFIYESKSLFDIFSEIENNLNFEVLNLTKKDISNINFKNYRDYLIISLKDLKLSNVILVENIPIRFTKLLERINIEFLKKNFNEQSNITVSKYIINTNSREMILYNQKLRLTEKEINMILYLTQSKKPIKINELQEKVWGYQSKLETHTVETHIHRLRKKLISFSEGKLTIKNGKFGYCIT